MPAVDLGCNSQEAWTMAWQTRISSSRVGSFETVQSELDSEKRMYFASDCQKVS
jgi:hypothetical protein